MSENWAERGLPSDFTQVKDLVYQLKIRRCRKVYVGQTGNGLAPRGNRHLHEAVAQTWKQLVTEELARLGIQRGIWSPSRVWRTKQTNTTNGPSEPGVYPKLNFGEADTAVIAFNTARCKWRRRRMPCSALAP